MNSLQKPFLVLSTLVSIFFLLSTRMEATVTPPGHQVQGVQPAQVKTATLMPGLKMHYYLDFTKDSLAELPGADSWPGEVGDPVAEVNSNFSRSPVFSSGSNSDVGIRLSGYLYCDVEGTYFFQALSNDGIMVYIDNQLVLEDPVKHADRLTSFSSVELAEPGYYPIVIEYFQSRGTGSLKLFWKKPDQNGLVPIPESGFWHSR